MICGCGREGAGKDNLCMRCRGRKACEGRRKYHWTPAMDAELTRAYAIPGRMREAIDAIKAIVVKYRIPRYIVNNRARTLGLGLRTQNHWRPEEIETVREYAGELSLCRLSRRLNRSQAAVSHMIYKLGMSAAVTEGYTVKELKDLFGVSIATIDKWIGRGWMPMNEDGRVPYETVERFCWSRMQEYRLGACQDWWLKTMLNPKIGRIDLLLHKGNHREKSEAA